MRDKQIEMYELAKQMSEAISTAVEQWYIEDEAKLEAVLRANGWRKASDVARKIFDEIEKDGKYAISFVENHKSYSEEVRQAKLECYKDIQNYIAELKKKYESEEK